MLAVARRAFVTLLLTLAVADAGAADLEGASAPFAWRIADVRQGPTTVDGKPYARHEFTLVLKNVAARAVTLRQYSAAVSYAGIPAAESVATADPTLTPGREYLLHLYALLPCAEASTPCRFAVGPAWRVVLSGRDSGGAEFAAPIDVTLPVEPGRPIVIQPRLRVTRAPATAGADAGRIPARFTSNVILVPVSAGGQDLVLLFDTGSQISILRPDAARRLGLAASADAPLVPTMGLGGQVNAALVEWPALRIGDYVVEHLTGGIAALPEFPIPIDGLIGANLIEAFRVTIDHRARELRLEPAP
jgi:Aspartyl protease